MIRSFKLREILTIIFMFITFTICTKENELNKSVNEEQIVDQDSKVLDTGNTSSSKLLVKEENDETKKNFSKVEDDHYDKLVKSITLKENGKQCNTDLLDIFGISGTKLTHEKPATFNEKLYCSRNKNTCCSVDNIKSTNMAFAKGAQALKSKFEAVEELLTLFRGPLFQEKAMEFKKYKQCSHWVNDIEIELSGEKFYFFDHPTQKYMRDVFESLLLRTELYVKKNLWFYGDMICLVCSPEHQDYFNLKENSSKIYMHTNTCSEMMGERDYELRLYTVYHKFIYKIMEFIECINANEDELAEKESMTEEELNKEKENKTKSTLFQPLNHDKVAKFQEDFIKCWDDEDVNEQECVDMCTKDLRTYKFPFENLIHNYHASLQVLYKFLTEKSIEEYYTNIKEKNWNLEDSENIVSFFQITDKWNHYNLEDISWVYKSRRGHDIYKEIMSKRYLDFEGENIFTLMWVTLLVFAFKL